MDMCVQLTGEVVITTYNTLQWL